MAPAAPRSRTNTATRMVFNFPGLGGGNGNKAGGAKGGVLVVGATGRTGKRIVQVLQSQGKAVTAGVRDVEKGKEVLGAVGKGKLSFLQVGWSVDWLTLPGQLVVWPV